MGLSGVSFSASVGTIDPKDQVVGLTGLSITSTLGAPFIIHYQDVDTGIIRIIVMFQRAQILAIRVLQLDQIQVITT